MRILSILIAILLLAACSTSIQERENIFRYNESKGIPTLDPAFARNQTIIWPVNQIFNGLLQLNKELEVQPCIAHSWECSQDGTEYTFCLRSDVFYLSIRQYRRGGGGGERQADFY